VSRPSAVRAAPQPKPVSNPLRPALGPVQSRIAAARRGSVLAAAAAGSQGDVAVDVAARSHDISVIVEDDAGEDDEASTAAAGRDHVAVALRSLADAAAAAAAAISKPPGDVASQPQASGWRTSPGHTFRSVANAMRMTGQTQPLTSRPPGHGFRTAAGMAMIPASTGATPLGTSPHESRRGSGSGSGLIGAANTAGRASDGGSPGTPPTAASTAAPVTISDMDAGSVRRTSVLAAASRFGGSAVSSAPPAGSPAWRTAALGKP